MTNKNMSIKCIFCNVWVQNFVWNFKGAFWNFTQNFEPIHCKICILRGVKNLTNHDILNLCETGPRCLHAASSFSQALALEKSKGSLRLMTSQFKDIINDKQKYVNKMHILQCMGSKFCVKFQRRLLKFNTKFWTHTLQNMHFTRC